MFGSSEPLRAPALADDLGVALQLTNILRDILEDREMGRMYLASDDIERYGVAADLSGPDDAIERLLVSRRETGRMSFVHRARSGQSRQAFGLP